MGWSLVVVAIAAFVGVAALVGGVALLVRGPSASRVEDRLEILTGLSSPAAKQNLFKTASLLAEPLDAMPGFFETLLSRFGNVRLLLEQADVSIGLSQLVMLCGLLGLGAGGAAVLFRVNLALVPLLGLAMASLPILWVLWRRRKRLKQFAVQLPDALDMLGRALRAGQSLSAGFSLVANEMPAPLGKEFGRVFDEQNLGVPLNESLTNLTDRVPNLDLKFFATAVILQRQTGGDLAEILDKISALIRQRFQIWGQIQALTGEGRLSGIVLMALPVVLFLAVYKLNPDYFMVLFTDPLGKKMLAAAIFLQVLGALVIRKIVNIKV